MDAPQALYERPVNLFVAGFIGSPAMNMVEAELARADGGLLVSFGGFRLGVPEEVVAERPGLLRYEGRRVVLGIRPEDMEDASLASDAPEDRRLSAVVDLREALGSQVIVHFTVQAPPVLTEDVRELATDVGADALAELEHTAKTGSSTFVAALNPRTRTKEGERLELVVDTRRLRFFDPETGLGIYSDGRADPLGAGPCPPLGWVWRELGSHEGCSTA